MPYLGCNNYVKSRTTEHATSFTAAYRRIQQQILLVLYNNENCLL